VSATKFREGPERDSTRAGLSVLTKVIDKITRQHKALDQ